MTTEFLNKIYNQIKKPTVLISALIGAIYSIVFQLFYLNDTSNLFIFIISALANNIVNTTTTPILDKLEEIYGVG